MKIELQSDGHSTDECVDFLIYHEAGVVPATFWNAPAESDTPPPITLAQHGGPLHKRHERSDWLARTIVARAKSSVLLIDGPIHGMRRTDRPTDEAMLADFKRYWRELGGIDRMVADWRIALDAVLREGWADPDRIAWFGVSMGTGYGIPVCAADERIRTAALGLWGTDWGQDARLLDDARRMRTPALFHIKSEDEVFSTAGQRTLFDALGSPDKCLRTFPGGHSLTAPGQLEQLLEFIAQAHLVVSNRAVQAGGQTP